MLRLFTLRLLLSSTRLPLREESITSPSRRYSVALETVRGLAWGSDCDGSKQIAFCYVKANENFRFPPRMTSCCRNSSARKSIASLCRPLRCRQKTEAYGKVSSLRSAKAFAFKVRIDFLLSFLGKTSREASKKTDPGRKSLVDTNPLTHSQSSRRYFFFCCSS